ncbi:alpha/beta fold hydrolase [Patescibacteria group bacterium]|nr:alpha/beta fold hydrolase [Patescibacteria group bacterium]
MKNILLFIIILSISIIGFLVIIFGLYGNKISFPLIAKGSSPIETFLKKPVDHPLSIETMRKELFPGSDIVIEETLADAGNYHQYIASYQSEGLKIFGLLTVPITDPPAGGFPVIIFNHGYIAPNTYVTTERYVAYVDAFARNGYIVFKPDYRGHGNSDGKPEGAYYSPAYATDVLNALSSIKKLQVADPNRIGMWGHSMGGNIVLRDIVVDTKDIKAAVIWGGVVGSYDDLLNNWHKRATYQPGPQELALRNNYRKNLTDQYGTPDTNPSFWKAVDPLSYISDITTPIQLHTGENDEEVPPEFSASLYEKLIIAGKTAEYYIYPEGDHNISSPNFETAMDRSVAFFDKYLK